MNYAKAAAAVLATVMSVVVASLAGDAAVSSVEWVNVAIAGVGAAAVFAAPNVPGSRYTKAIIAVLTAVLTLLADLLLVGSLGTSEWLQLGVIALGALGVYAAPSSGTREFA